MKRVVRTALGVAVVLAWWTLHGGSGGESASLSQIPPQVWEGGGGTLALEFDSSSAAQVRVSFEDHQAEREEARRLDTWQDVPAGHHAFSIDVPAGVGGTVELDAVEPKPGDRLSWKIAVNGAAADEQTEPLERALEPGTAFFLQTGFEDYATATLDED